MSAKRDGRIYGGAGGKSTRRSRLTRGWRKSDVEEYKAHEA